MVTKELLEYIKLQHEKGYSLINIRNTLRAGGWNTEDLDQAVKILKETLAPHEKKPFFGTTPVFKGNVGSAIGNIRPEKTAPWQPVASQERVPLVDGGGNTVEPKQESAQPVIQAESRVSPVSLSENNEVIEEESHGFPEEYAHGAVPKEVIVNNVLHELPPTTVTPEAPVFSQQSPVSVTEHKETRITPRESIPNPKQIEPQETVLEFIERMKKERIQKQEGGGVSESPSPAQTFKSSLVIPEHLRRSDGDLGAVSVTQSTPLAPPPPRQQEVSAQKLDSQEGGVREQRTHSIIPFVLIILGLLLGAGGVFAYLTVFSKPSTLPWAEVVEGMRDVRSFVVDGSITTTVVGYDEFSASLGIKGFFDFSDTENTLADVELKGEVLMREPRSRALVTMDGVVPIRVIGKEVYIQPNGLPPVFGLGFLENQWVAINLREVPETYGGLRLDEGVYDEFAFEEVRDEIWEGILKYPLVSVVGPITKETINSEATYRFEVETDYENLQLLQNHVQEIVLRTYGTDALIDNTIPQQEALNEHIVSQKNEVWIGANDKLVRRIRTEIIFKLPEEERLKLEGVLGVAGDIALVVDIFAQEYGSSRSVIPPANSILLEGVMRDLFTRKFSEGLGN